jgi:hypothetical protein
MMTQMRVGDLAVKVGLKLAHKKVGQGIKIRLEKDGSELDSDWLESFVNLVSMYSGKELTFEYRNTTLSVCVAK